MQVVVCAGATWRPYHTHNWSQSFVGKVTWLCLVTLSLLSFLFCVVLCCFVFDFDFALICIVSRNTEISVMVDIIRGDIIVVDISYQTAFRAAV